MRTNLKVFRTALKLRQSDIAHELGVSRGTYAFIEQGNRDGTQEFWRKLQRTYNVPDEQMYSLMKIDEVQNEKPKKSNNQID